jgi:transcriptional regulator with XRE-family HTH domain
VTLSLRFRYRDRSEFDARENLRGLGHLLISLRIAQGISQRELAKRLNVHESQVSRDGETRISESRANGLSRILEALNVRLRTRVEIEPPRERVRVSA